MRGVDRSEVKDLASDEGERAQRAWLPGGVGASASLV